MKVAFNASGPRNKGIKINISCDPKVYYPKDNLQLFHIIIDITLEAERCFELKILGVGNFEVDTVITPEIKKKFVNANAAAIMFPYIRSFITTFYS